VKVSTKSFPSECLLGYLHLPVGGIFCKGYENVELVSSKHITCFSDFRLPLESPDYMSFQDYLNYLNEYCSYFELWPYIRLNCKVTRITRCGIGDKHIITYLDQFKDHPTNTKVDALAQGYTLPRGFPTSMVSKILRLTESKSFTLLNIFTGNNYKVNGFLWLVLARLLWT
jgi:dimethylaniline monooxygenase (N-oxide forming)